MALAPGTVLGVYEIQSLLGSGGMGEVYRARDGKLKRDVAIKILPEQFSRDADRVTRFQREAEVLASLNHSNIASIHDLNEAGGSRFLVLELVEGETLAERIGRGALPIPEAVAIARQISEALEAAHEKGIVHRDLKPANVKITPDGKVKVLDFGLAKVLEASPSAMDASKSPTLVSGSIGGVILGTAPYMSPEQARGQTADSQSDVWAFGCVLYEMLTGEPAFSGETITDVLGGIVRVDPDWNPLPSETPPMLRLLLRQCLQKNRAARLHHIGDVRIQMESALIETRLDVPTKKRRPIAWMVVSSLLMLSVVVLGWLAWNRFSSDSNNLGAIHFTLSMPDKMLYPGGPSSPHASVSPDGRKIAFMTLTENGGGARIWLRTLDSSEPRMLPGTEGASFTPAFWSPDSRHLAFFGQGKLKRLEVAGGPAQTLCDAVGSLTGSWNKDGVILFDSGGVIKRVPAGGGQPESVTTLDASRQEVVHVLPKFLPDGDHFLYFARGILLDSGTLMVGSVTSKEVKRLMPIGSAAFYDSGNLIYVREATLMAQPFDTKSLQLSGEAKPIAEGIRSTTGGPAAFSASGNGVITYRTGSSTMNRKLAWFDRSGKELGTVGQVASYRNPELSPDQKRLAVVRTDPLNQNDDIWIIDLARGVPSKLTFDPGPDDYPIWSPDGEKIAFGSSRNGVDSIFVKPSSGAAGEELLVKSAYIPRDWSSDKKYVVYGVDAGTELMLQPLLGERKAVPYIPKSNFLYAQAKLSPDAKWLAFYSNEAERNEIYVQSFPVPSAKYQVSTNGGIGPRWRHDGKEIFYVEGQKLMAVAVRPTAAGFEVSKPQPLFDIGVPPTSQRRGVRHQYDVSADGQRFLVNVALEDANKDPVTVVVNWPAAIKR